MLDGAKSSTANVESGVLQGSVLGSLLFLLYINDLPDAISTESTTRLFADGCALYRNIETQEDTQSLQDDIDKLQKWETEWMMEFHPKKCQVLQITNKRKTVNYPYNIHNHTLDIVDSVVYLGVTMHKSLKWNKHINEVTEKPTVQLLF